LDHHVQCGNSLLGSTPALLKKGIPDQAFKPVEGDDKDVCRQLRSENKSERQGQRRLWGAMPSIHLGNMAQTLANIDAEDDSTPAAVAAKEKHYHDFITSADYENARFLADTWCAAFVWPKTDPVAPAVTTETIRRIEDNPHEYPEGSPIRVGVRKLANQYQFFHWHLAFPEVFRLPEEGKVSENDQTGWDGGFDVMLGNPPWVRQEFLRNVKKLLSIHRSFKSTADLSVLFLELSILTTNNEGFVALLTPNKWFRSNYAVNLREVVRQACLVVFLVDFGHSRNLFPEADTFPAAVILKPVRQRVDDETTFRFLKAHDSDRARKSLKELIVNNTIHIPHRQLLTHAWQLEHPHIYNLLCELLDAGQPLKQYVGNQVYSGIKSGFNDAFYINTKERDAFVESNPGAASLLKPFLRGRDMSRWTCDWENRWHIVIPSSQNKAWPWSQCADENSAEVVFAQTYPLIHAHLKQHKAGLKKRADRGTFWWELRACQYYDIFDNPKILVQCIAYDSQFLIDSDGFFINNSSLLIPSSDLYLLAVLNSRVMWWIINRTFQHMKDDAVSMEIHYLENVPIPEADDETRSRIEKLAKEVIEAKVARDPEKVLEVDTQLSSLVEFAFGLRDAESQILAGSLPPRDPLERQLSHLDNVVELEE